MCYPHSVELPHEQLHGAADRAKQSRIMISHRLHGRALQDKVPLIMDSMHAVCSAGTGAGPATLPHHSQLVHCRVSLDCNAQQLHAHLDDYSVEGEPAAPETRLLSINTQAPAQICHELELQQYGSTGWQSSSLTVQNRRRPPANACLGSPSHSPARQVSVLCCSVLINKCCLIHNTW